MARTNASWRHGVFRAVAAGAIVGAMVAAGTARAATLAEAEGAFERGQFADASRIYRELARGGEPEAAFQLGLINDLGLGRSPDPVEAFRRYLEAAQRGHAAAQFNVAVMLDAGTGTSPSPSGAATWYARAAADGFSRAAYNLALLYADGNGLPRNIGLAEAWMRRAASALPAARERLDALQALGRENPDRPVAPVPLAAELVRGAGEGATLELVWTAGEQPSGTRYSVELDGPGRTSKGRRFEPIETSALAIELPSEMPRRWRVHASTGERSTASGWQPLSIARDDATPADGGSIEILYSSGDPKARAMATAISRDLADDGLAGGALAVRDAPVSGSEVRYFFDDDAQRAREVATALPMRVGEAVLRPDPTRVPGTIEVHVLGDSGP